MRISERLQKPSPAGVGLKLMPFLKVPFSVPCTSHSFRQAGGNSELATVWHPVRAETDPFVADGIEGQVEPAREPLVDHGHGAFVLLDIIGGSKAVAAAPLARGRAVPPQDGRL